MATPKHPNGSLAIVLSVARSLFLFGTMQRACRQCFAAATAAKRANVRINFPARTRTLATAKKSQPYASVLDEPEPSFPPSASTTQYSTKVLIGSKDNTRRATKKSSRVDAPSSSWSPATTPAHHNPQQQHMSTRDAEYPKLSQLWARPHPAVTAAFSLNYINTAKLYSISFALLDESSVRCHRILYWRFNGGSLFEAWRRLMVLFCM
jgi:hypothetical protein